jgi:hypothetical protein
MDERGRRDSSLKVLKAVTERKSLDKRVVLRDSIFYLACAALASFEALMKFHG